LVPAGRNKPFSRRITIDTEQKLEVTRALLDEKKALDIEVIALEGRALFADYFVICTGTSNTHIKAIADGLLVEGKERGLRKLHTEGYSQAKWVLIDYGDIIVHIFAQEERDFYDIESLWRQTESLVRNKAE